MSTISNSFDGREWHTIVPKVSTNNSFQFSIASYNVLSQILLEDNIYLYGKSERTHLQWECRKWKLWLEFSHYNADIFSLQEVEPEYYHNFLKLKFNKSGYESVYKKRTGDKPDGCAIFYRKSKFVCVLEKKIAYKNINCNVLDRDNVAILLLLKPLLSTQPSVKKQEDLICVTNTHIVFNERRGDVKLAQIMTLLASINEFCPKHVPVIMCGDYNLRPFSDLYNFIIKGRIVCSECNLKAMSGQQTFKSNYKPLTEDFLGRRSGLTFDCHFTSTNPDNPQNNKKRKNSLVDTEDSTTTGQTGSIRAIIDPSTYNDEYPCLARPFGMASKGNEVLLKRNEVESKTNEMASKRNEMLKSKIKEDDDFIFKSQNCDQLNLSAKKKNHKVKASKSESAINQNFSDASRNILKSIKMIKLYPTLGIFSHDPSPEIVSHDPMSEILSHEPTPECMSHDPSFFEIVSHDPSPDMVSHDSMLEKMSHNTKSGILSHDSTPRIKSYKPSCDIVSYDLMRDTISGKVSHDSMSGNVSDDQSCEIVSYDPGPGIVWHNFKFQSSYEHWKNSRKNEEVTTKHGQGGCTVDYIFYEPRSNKECGEERLTLTGRLNLFTLDHFIRYPFSLPDLLHGSDHYMLMAEFSYQP